VKFEHVPHVPPTERRELQEIADGIRRLILKYGYMETPDVHEEVAATLAGFGCPHGAADVLYVISRETYIGTSRNKMGAVSESIFEVLSRNAKNATEYFNLPPDQVVEVGMQIDL
jgi:KUP system potassium uptake protein